MKIIAEAGVNHNGDLQRALALIDAAKEAGADAVKFQTFKADLLATSSAGKAAYQRRSTPGDESQLAMIKKLELSQAAFLELASHCHTRGIEFLSTAFESVSLRFLYDKVGLRTFKIASGELTNAPLLLEHARLADHLIISTGMATLDEIELALGVVAYGFQQEDRMRHPDRRVFAEAYENAMQTGSLRARVTLLHCTTEYPAPVDQINLRAMSSMREHFALPVGYSDHTLGITIPIVATAMGACVIEKHFTLNKSLAGPDHAMSLDPAELKSMVTAIADAGHSMGNAGKSPGLAEKANIDVVRKSLVASCDIAIGETFTEHNLTVKRPGTGLPPMDYWCYLGKQSDRQYCQDEFICQSEREPA